MRPSRIFNHWNSAHLSKTILMFIDLDSCHLRMPHLWDVPLRKPIILYVERNSALRLFMSDMFDLAGTSIARSTCIRPRRCCAATSASPCS